MKKILKNSLKLIIIGRMNNHIIKIKQQLNLIIVLNTYINKLRQFGLTHYSDNLKITEIKKA
jgi:hypothetical protein